MANNEILKTIKVNVDSSQYKALQRSIEELVKLEKEINKTIKEQNSLLHNSLGFLNKEVNVAKKRNKTEAENLKMLRARLAEQRKLNAESRAFQRELKDLEEPKMSFLEQTLRYGGFKGMLRNFSDKFQKQGNKKVADYDDKIASKQGQIADWEEERDFIKDQIESGKYRGINKTKGEARIKELEGNIESGEANLKDLQRGRSKTIGDTKFKVNQISAIGTASEKAAETFKKVSKVLLKPFRDLKTAVMDAVHQMLSFNTGVATFNAMTSLVTNSAAREQMLKYGLNASQNYAFSQAKSMLNIQSDEDLMYMNADQREKLLEYMDRYSRWYDEMDRTGVLRDIQEMQLEFRELKQEIAMDFLQWVAENKDTIMGAIKGIWEIVKGIANVIIKILDVLSFGKYKGEAFASASDYNNSTTNNNRNTTINVNANTTNNATGVLSSQDALDKYNEENWNKLAKQLVTAVGG